MNEDILKEEIAMLESNNRAMQEEMARTWEKYDKVINNWNELKEWLQERKFVYNITGEDLDEDTSITEVLDKMQEIESRKM